MSGREHEPVAAFFPSIDRNLILDLDRHLRANKAPPTATPPAPEPAPPPVAPPPAQQFAPPPPSRQIGRPNIASVVGAVEQAAQAITAMTGRIDELENHIGELETVNRQLEGQLGEADQNLQALEGRLRSESDRATRLETIAAQQTSRANDLERELSAVHGDLARVTEAITAALGLPEE